MGVAAATLVASAPSAAHRTTLFYPTSVPRLANRLLVEYHDSDIQRLWDNRFRLELASGRYENALTTLRQLRALQSRAHPQSATRYVQYQIYATAMLEASRGVRFDEAFRTAFSDAVTPLNDIDAAYVIREFTLLSNPLTKLNSDLAAESGQRTISFEDALKLVRDYDLSVMYRLTKSQVISLVNRDDERRYRIDLDLKITAPDGRNVCAYVVRPRTTLRLASLLSYSIYADRRIVYQDARFSAAHGYAGINAYTPGTACSNGPIVPYVNEGLHADAVINWISRQRWSNGQVGMFGGSYSAFALWAAAKRAPPALRSLMSSVSNAPGIDTPMEGSIFETWVYPWPLYTHTPWLNAGVETSPVDLAALERRWYLSGRSYRSLDQISGPRNPIWNFWLDHPDYDSFWRDLIPYREGFTRFRIPVLLTDGYLNGQNVGGLYYFTQYRHFDPRAEAYLVVGPYDHIAGQFGTVQSNGQDEDAIDGVSIDPAAHIDMQELRFQWFDYTLREKKKPLLLGATINYEVMHGNHWEHTATLRDSGPQSVRIPIGGVTQSVNFAERSEVDRKIPNDAIDTYLGKAYSSPPFRNAGEFNGVFSGKLSFICNKPDFDFNITIYEQLSDGESEEVTNYMTRASYVGHREFRALLRPGEPTTLRFTSSRFTSWKVERNSRLVAVVSIVKDPGLEMNYGAATPVADQTIADASTPLRVRWLTDSVVVIPFRPLRQ